jgi:hypothetical protein
LTQVIIVALVQGGEGMSSPKSLAESTEFGAELPEAVGIPAAIDNKGSA